MDDRLVNVEQISFEDEKVEVHTIPLKHRIYTNGYLFIEKEKPKNLHIDNIKNYRSQSNCTNVSWIF